MHHQGSATVVDQRRDGLELSVVEHRVIPAGEDLQYFKGLGASVGAGLIHGVSLSAAPDSDISHKSEGSGTDIARCGCLGEKQFELTS